MFTYIGVSTFTFQRHNWDVGFIFAAIVSFHKKLVLPCIITVLNVNICYFRVRAMSEKKGILKRFNILDVSGRKKK